jgi:hypothetical protein
VTDDRFELLVEKHLEGSLSEDEARELLQAPASRLLDEMAMAALLVRAHGRPADLAPRVQAALRPGSQKKEMVEGVLHRLPSRRRSARFLVPLAVAAAVLVVALRLLRPQTAPPDRSGAPTPQALRATQSVQKAVAYLRTAELPSCKWQAPMPSDDLVLLALAQAGVPGSDPGFAALFERARGAALQRVYTVSVHALLLQKLDPVKHRDRLAACARFLVDQQCLNGQWSYGAGTPAPSPPLSGNNSCSIFAALGLRACADSGIRIPNETLDRAARWWRECRRPYPDVGDGEVAGWCYTREESPHRPYGSMTAGAVAALIIEDSLLGNDWRKDAAVRAGLRWLTKYFTVSENFGPVEELMAKELASDSPNPKTEVYYALWAMGQAAGVAGLDKLGVHDWYAEGLQELLSQQRPDGSWYGGARRCQPVYDTCYAILFLTHTARPF